MRENRSYFAALIIVALAAPAAALLFVVALVVWLAELMGSFTLPAIIVATFLALLAFVLYKISLRETLRELHSRIGVIYDVTKMLREGVEWGMKLLFRNIER
jgi:hypothetical protein